MRGPGAHQVRRPARPPPRPVPEADRGQVDALLGDLLAQNLLITSLWAPMTTVDALGHVCAELEKADARSLEGVGELVRALVAIRTDLTSHEPHAPPPP